MSKSYPLELILRAHGPAELVDAHEKQIWASDSDDTFRDEFPDDFLSEEDIPDILDYLKDERIINDEEYGRLSSDAWDCTVETLESTAGELPAPLDDDEEDDDDEEEEDDDD
jgi:hypothetical protein